MISGVFGKIQTMRLLSFFSIIIAVLFLTLSAVTYAAEMTYTGNVDDLQECPAWFHGGYDFCLFFGTKAAPLSSGNRVTVNYNPKAAGVYNPDFIFGGLSQTENVMGNSIVLLNGRNNIDIYGGYSIDGTSTGNTVTVSGGSVRRYVYGGWSDNGGSANNITVISGGSVGDHVIGGGSREGDATGNTVTISDGLVENTLIGGYSENGIATDNTITISGGSVGDHVIGGGSREGDATGNTVTISDGLVGNKLIGGSSENGTATGNTITISGGSVSNGSYGGNSFTGDAANNTIIISGGSVEGFIVGGSCRSGNATGNTITISGRPELTKAYIIGGFAGNSQGDVFTGNTLNLKSSRVSVKTVKNFECYNFYLPESSAADEVMLSVTDIVYLDGTTVTISLEGNSKLREGNKIVLIHTAWGFSFSPKNKSCKVKQNGLLYEFSIYTDLYNLWAKVTKISKAAK